MRNRFSFLLALALGVFMTGAAGAQSSPAAPAAGPSPVATADGETPGVQLQVTKFKREGDSVMLQFALVNNSDSAYDPNNLGPKYRSVDGVYLVDMAGKKKYEVVRDTDQNCVCSQNLSAIASKSSANVWAKFPAPPDSVQKLSIVVPHFTPLDDVPLSK